MSHQPIQSDSEELAELHAAGALSDAELADLESKALGGEGAMVRALGATRSVREALLASAQGALPPERVRAALEARVRSAASKPRASDDVDAGRTLILRSASMDWRETGVPGVQFRNLFADAQSNRLTVLFRMGPGTVFPDHEHGGVEECYVLEGDLSIAGTVLRANDYIRVPKGGKHGEPRTTGGCLLLITCPLAGEAA